MDKEELYSGTGLLPGCSEPRPVTVVVRDGIITHVEEETQAADRWISPAFFNAHTHLADTVALDLRCSGTLEELVTPPDGLKHRILAKTTPCELISAMRATISDMIHTGTAGFADFREGGVSGVRYLQDACTNLSCHAIILGRDGGETAGDGAGISSARDTKGYAEIADRMKKEGKLVGFHAGERDNADIDQALDCEPDFLVHCTHATPHQVRTIADAGIPVVLCPRSNFLLGVTHSSLHPPVREMTDQGVQILFGTDNAMFVNPSVMEEISFCHTVYGIDPTVLFEAATRGFPPAGIDHAIKPGNKANFFIADILGSNLIYSHDPVSSLVKRAPSCRICTTIFYI